MMPVAESPVLITPTTAGIVVGGIIVMTLIIMVWKDPARGQVVIVYISSGIARALGRRKKSAPPLGQPERRTSKPGRRRQDFVTLSVPYDELRRNTPARTESVDE